MTNIDTGSVNVQFFFSSNRKKMSFGYTTEQSAFIVEHNFRSMSYTTIKIQFQQEFPNVTILADSTIKKIGYKFCTEYILSNLLRVGQPSALIEEEKLQFCERIEEEPGTLVRRLSQQTGYTCETVCCALRAEGMHLYCISTFQEFSGIAASRF